MPYSHCIAASLEVVGCQHLTTLSKINHRERLVLSNDLYVALFHEDNRDILYFILLSFFYYFKKY